MFEATWMAAAALITDLRNHTPFASSLEYWILPPLVGKDQKCTPEMAEIIREDSLQQNGLD